MFQCQCAWSLYFKTRWHPAKRERERERGVCACVSRGGGATNERKTCDLMVQSANKHKKTKANIIGCLLASQWVQNPFYFQPASQLR